MVLSDKIKIKFAAALLVFVFLASIVTVFGTVSAADLSNNKGVKISSDFTDATFLSIVRKITGRLAEPIYDTDVINIEELELPAYKRITSLAGIEHFKSLKVLVCEINELTELNMSKNTKLETLQCTNNFLTILDISQNPNLQILQCSGNSLTTLDISQNPNLQTLQCDNNPLTSIDTSQNTKLETLSCNNIPLISTDIRQNLNLKTLQCNDNSLSRLDVSQNTKLETLVCYDNQLTVVCE